MRKYSFSMLSIVCLIIAITAASAQAKLMSWEKDGWTFDLGVMIELDAYNTHDGAAVQNGYSYSTDDTTFDVLDDSHIDLQFRNKDWSGRFQLRSKSADYGREPMHFYWIERNFDSFRIMVGRNKALTWNAILLPPPMKIGMGQILSHKPAPQIRVTVPIGKKGMQFLFAAMKVDNYVRTTGAGGYIVDGAVDYRNTLPSLEARLDIPAGKANFRLITGYEGYTEIDSNNKKYDIPSYMFGVQAKYSIGKFLFEATAHTDHNNYNHNANYQQKGYFYSKALYGDNYTNNYYGNPKYDADTDSIIDSDYMGCALGINYFFNDWMSFHFGVSGGETEDDLGNKDPAIAYEIMAAFTIYKHMQVIPFFNITDWLDRKPVGEASVDEGKTIKFGFETVIWF